VIKSFVHAKGINMAQIVKFVYVMIIFLSLFLVEASFTRESFLSSSHFNYLYSFFSSSSSLQQMLDALQMLIAQLLCACFH
jgi:hypothetical protein